MQPQEELLPEARSATDRRDGGSDNVTVQVDPASPPLARLTHNGLFPLSLCSGLTLLRVSALLLELFEQGSRSLSTQATNQEHCHSRMTTVLSVRMPLGE